LILTLLSAVSAQADPLVVYKASSIGSKLVYIADSDLSSTGVLTVSEVIATTVTGNTGASDHGMLTGLGDDDHTQYVLDSEKANLVGTANRITVTGGTNAVLAATTLTLPQDIHTAATPTFSTLLLTGNVLTLDDGVDPAAEFENSGSGTLLSYGGTPVQNWTDAQVNIYMPTILSDNLTVDSPTFVVDSTNNRVGVGTASPAAAFHVKGTTSTTGGIRIEDNGVSPKVRLNVYPVDTFNVGLALGQSAGNMRLFNSSGGEFGRLDPTATNPSFFTSKKMTVGASDGLSVFNVEGGVTVGSSAYVGNATYTAANGEMFLERNLMLGDVTTSGTALINMGVNRTGSLPLIAMANNGSGDAVVLVTNAGNVWQWGSRNSATGDPFVIGGGTSPTVTDLIFITKGGEMGVTVAVPDAMLDVSSAATYGGPVLELDQKDDDQNFISFLGNDDLTGPGLDPVSNSALPTQFADFQTSVRVEVNGVAYRIPLY
jgi:hypothetical protein